MELSKNDQDLLINSSKVNVFKLAVKSAFNHIIITNIDGKIIFANSAAERITGYSKEEIIGSTPRLWGGQMPKGFYENMWHVIKDEGKPFQGELTNRRKNGILYIAKSIISPIFDDENKIIGFVGTEEDITKAKEADRMKTEFVSITAHQLKTPMTSIKWNLELLKGKIFDKLDDEGKEAFSFIDKSNLNLINLTDILLNITRIESGRLTIIPKPIKLGELLNNVIKTLEPEIRNKNIQLNKEIVKEDEVNADSELVYQLLSNLISNAIKYSPDNSKIDIKIMKDNENFILSIKDNGYGIPESEKKKVFQKHFRGTNIIDKRIGGTGLGLYFVKLIVDSYGGEIWFESKENEGSTFTFTIPIIGMKSKDGEIRLTSVGK